MILAPAHLKRVLTILAKFAEEQGNLTVEDFIKGWNKYQTPKIERI